MLVLEVIIGVLEVIDWIRGNLKFFLCDVKINIFEVCIVWISLFLVI